LVKHAGRSLHHNLNPVVEVVAAVFCDEGQDAWVGANRILPLMGMEVEVAFEWVCLGPLSAVNNWVTSLYRAQVLVDIHQCENIFFIYTIHEVCEKWQTIRNSHQNEP
jgi:hypothetical protein